jgi:hypothetical protein
VFHVEAEKLRQCLLGLNGEALGKVLDGAILRGEEDGD